MAVRTSATECDVCKQRLINRRHQACQIMPEMLEFYDTSSGVIDVSVSLNWSMQCPRFENKREEIWVKMQE